MKEMREVREKEKGKDLKNHSDRGIAHNRTELNLNYVSPNKTME